MADIGGMKFCALTLEKQLFVRTFVTLLVSQRSFCSPQASGEFVSCMHTYMADEAGILF
jgi:hypothetical protein